MLSDKNIETFQMLYKKHFGIEISKEDAYEKGSSLIRFIQVVYFPERQQKHEVNTNKI